MVEQRVGAMAEDYVTVIWKAQEWSPAAITTNEIAATLAVTPSTVSGNLKRLARDGLIDYEPYGRIALTEAGRRIALRVVRRHRLLETYLVEKLAMGWDEVHEEADVLEHAISERVLARIDEALGHPSVDPHGDPIPDAEGRVTRPPAVLLRHSPTGHDAQVVRIADKEPDVLRYLDEHGVRVGTPVQVTGRRESVGLVTVRLGADEQSALSLTDAVADAVWVSR